MTSIEKKKQKEINDIVFIIKLSSILFCAIALITNVFTKENIEGNSNIINIGVMIAIVSIFMVIFAFRGYYISTERNKRDRMFKIIEICIFMIAFCIVIVLSGANESDYKFLFLFLIISTTIQGGLCDGLSVATLSSAIILIIDIFTVSYSKVNLYFENDLVLVGVFLITAWVVGYYVKSADQQIKDLQALINEDSLTGLYNETYFSENLKRKLELCRKYDLEIALLTIDIDYFKEYNDLYGKEQGNEVIKSIASIIRECTRKEHIVSRVGGGKFTVLVPGMQLEKAMNLGESIRKAINDEYFKGEEEQPNGRITVSVGISHYPSIAVDEESLIQSSEDALSRAKFFNKNSVEIYNQILENIQKSNNGFVNSVKGLLNKLNLKDKFSYSHVQRVVIYSRLIASQLNLSEEDTKLLVGGAYMHDIGKVNISENILSKKKGLSEDEWKDMMNHPKYAAELMKDFNDLDSIIPIVLHHHEKYDGTGYPLGLKGEEIPYLARLLTVIDAFDAMTSYRPYNKIKTYPEAIEELRRNAGTQFDPEIVELFINAFMNGISMNTY